MWMETVRQSQSTKQKFFLVIRRNSMDIKYAKMDWGRSMTKSEDWDKKGTPRGRFNPLDIGTIFIGLVVFIIIVFGYHVVISLK